MRKTGGSESFLRFVILHKFVTAYLYNVILIIVLTLRVFVV